MENGVYTEFLSLPAEVRRYFYNFSPREHLKSLSQCSKKLRNEILPSLWRKVKVTWTTLQQITPKLSQGPLENMRLISHLEFGHSADKLDKEYLSFGFALFLRECDPERLKSLTISNYLVARGLRFTSDIFPNLERLELCDVDADFYFLSKFTKLQSLVLRSCDITLNRWKDICQMKNLTTLELSDSHSLSTSDFVKVDFQLTDLLRLDLSYTDVSNEFLFMVSTNCRKLKYLDISCAKYVTDFGLSCISLIRTLRYLNLAECSSITDDGLFYVSQLPLLEHLNLDCMEKMSPRCLTHVIKLKTLTYLNINHILIGENDESFIPIQEMTSLRTLEMYGADKLTDASLEIISHLVHLEKLEISECENFTDEGLVHLTKLSRLRALKAMRNQSTKFARKGLKSHGLLKLLVNEF